jgi:hypothetical protein
VSFSPSVPRSARPPGAIPELGFSVTGARALSHAAVPTLVFGLHIEGVGQEPVRSVLLDVQIQIAARRRSYDGVAPERLLELFGTEDRWADTLRTLPWTRTTLVVPPFSGATDVDLELICTYDLEVSASKYLHALRDGEVPLEFLFSGTMFYSGASGQLQTARIAWDKEAEYAMPVRVWREAIDRHFPHSAWLRLEQDSFDRLHAYRSRHALSSWEQAIDVLLGDASEQEHS